MRSFSISSQFVLSLVILFGLSYNAHGSPSVDTNKTTYKVENCDCLGFSDDIPTFLSDLPGGETIEIFGEGKSPQEAQKQAQNMCVENYRNFASVDETETAKTETQTNKVTHNGCQLFKSTVAGEWVSL